MIKLKAHHLNLQLLALAIAFGLVFTMVAVIFVPSVREKVTTWVKTHVIGNEEIQKLIEAFKNNPETNVTVDGQGTGLNNPTEDELAGLLVIDENQDLGASALPPSMDMSTSPYFPIVGDQKSQGSCAAWAVTYYMYGYLEAKHYGWTDASTGNPAHLLSPAYTFNKATTTHLSNGKLVDSGSGLSSNAMILQKWGAASLATMPYDALDARSYGSEAAMREAVLHEAYSTVYISNDVNQITNMKTILNSGTPITFGMNALKYNSGFADGNFILSKAEYNTTVLNHAQCIVGYDDSITDDGDVGAFKVVNSWGSGFGNKGYYYMTYDAFKMSGAIMMPTYVTDKSVHSPTALGVIDFSSAPSREGTGTIIFTLLNVNTNAVVSTVRLYQMTTQASAYYMPYPIYPNKIIYDLSSMNTLGVGYNYKVQCDVPDVSIDGVIRAFNVEQYKPTYILNSPSYVAVSTTVPKNTPGSCTLLFTPGIVPPVIDTTPPVTTMTVSGQMGQNGWYITTTTFKLTTSETATTNYRFVGSSTWLPYSAEVTLPEGKTTVEYFSIDNAGNTESVKNSGLIQIDTSKPTVNAAVGATTTSITLNGGDVGSGVASILYSIDGGAWLLYADTFILVGSHILRYYSVDNAGIQSDITTISVG